MKKSKSRILYLLKILDELTDEGHQLSTNEIIEILSTEYGIPAYRTTVSDDIALLCEYGVDIVTVNSTQNKYFLASRLFELPELKLLIDAVESSKFITARKSEELVAKLAKLASRNDAGKLKRNLFVDTRIKPENEQVYYITDAINDAINAGCKISFAYCEYLPNKECISKNGGEPYVVSPYGLLWNGDYYYLVAFSEKHGKAVSFRVDRIESKPIILSEPIVPYPADFDFSDYSQKAFQMYTGEETQVELCCENELMKNIIDRFGDDVNVEIVDSNHFTVNVTVSVSPTFYGWVLGFGGKMTIKAPDNIKSDFVKVVNRIITKKQTTEVDV